MSHHPPAANTRPKARSIIRPWLPIVAACVLLSAYSAKAGATAPMLALSWRDKVDHFTVYALLAILVIQALPDRIQGTRRWLLAFALVSAFGMWDETIQHFNPARTGDPLDWLADSLGALTAVVAYTAIPQLRALANWRPLPRQRATLLNLRFEISCRFQSPVRR